MLCKDHHYKKKKSIVFLKKCFIGTIRFLFFFSFFFWERKKIWNPEFIFPSVSLLRTNRNWDFFFLSCVCAYLLNTHVAWIPCVGAKRFEKKKRKKKRCNPVHWPVSLPLGLFRTAVRKRKRREEREKRRQFNKPNPDVHFIHTPWTAFAWFISFSETIFHQPVFSAGKLLV